MAEPPMTELPSGVRAALLDRQRQQPSRLLNGGQCPPIYPNDVKLDATANEVVATFALTSGGSNGEPRVTQEVARLVFSWTMLDQLTAAGASLLRQAIDFRIENARQLMDTLQEIKQAVES